MERTLLDTDILSEVLKQRNVNVQRRSRQYVRSHGQVIFSAVTRFEVLRGYREQNATTQSANFLTLCRHSLVLPVTDAVFDRAADLWATAKRGGHPCQDADLLIAATALEHGLRLVTGNTIHFAWIAALPIDDWRLP